MGQWFWGGGGLAAGGRGEPFFFIIFFHVCMETSSFCCCEMEFGREYSYSRYLHFFFAAIFFAIFNFYANGVCVRGDMCTS